MKLPWQIALLVGILGAGSSLAQDELARKIDAIVTGPDYKQAHWGILIVDQKTGKPIYERNAEKLFAPASTTKLYSCATALATLGPDYCFETPVFLRGAIKNGIALGDLFLVASGDLTFGGRSNKQGKTVFKDHDHTYANSGMMDAELTDTNPLHALEELARQIKAAGVTELRGEIMIDDRLFSRARGSGSGPALICPIMVNDNVVDIRITPAAKVGERAKIEIRPQTEFIHVDAEVETVEAGKSLLLNLDSVSPTQFTARGRIPVGTPPQVRILLVDEPLLFARALFIECLRREGILVQAPLQRPVRFDLPDPADYPNMKRLALYRSAPLREAIHVTLKVSHNLYASTLPALVAARNGDRSVEAGLRHQGVFLKSLGIPVETISFGGGAGGANADAVTPAATVQLLQAMMKRPEWEAYRDGLPILGVDGTLADVVNKDSPARGKVRGKTGTLYWYDAMNERGLLRSKALAGVMETAKGTPLTFAIFVNDVPLPKGIHPSREGKIIGKICEIIYENGP